MAIKIFEPDWTEPERAAVQHLRAHPEEQRFDTPDFWAQVYWIAGQAQVAVYRKNEPSDLDPLGLYRSGFPFPELPKLP